MKAVACLRAALDSSVEAADAFASNSPAIVGTLARGSSGLEATTLFLHLHAPGIIESGEYVDEDISNLGAEFGGFLTSWTDIDDNEAVAEAERL